MARFDKYEPLANGFRAKLLADWAAADGAPIGVGLDTAGKVVPGAGNTGVIGVVILVGYNKKAGDVVDVMTGGEILEMTGLTAGTKITANTTTGVLSTTVAGATQAGVGFTVEADRLVVRTATKTP
jgi:hypothetical protein